MVEKFIVFGIIAIPLLAGIFLTVRWVQGGSAVEESPELSVPPVAGSLPVASSGEWAATSSSLGLAAASSMLATEQLPGVDEEEASLNGKSPQSLPEINPATGLLMLDGSGIDIAGNPYGFDMSDTSALNHDAFPDHDLMPDTGFASSFDDGFSVGSGDDDPF